MKNNRITLVLCILLAWSVMAVVLATPATATENKLLFVPDNSVSDGTPVQVVIYTDISETDKAIASSFDIEYDPNCIQDFPSFDSTGSNWSAAGGSVTCTTPDSGVLRFRISVGMNPAISGHAKVGTLTFTCNTDGCGSFLNFTDAKYTDASLPPQTIYPATDNGAFRCTSTLSGEDGNGENEVVSGNSGGGTITTPSPTPSPDSTPSPIQDTTSPQAPSLTPTATPTVTPVTTSNPAPASSPGAMRTPASSGFELMIAVGMFVAAGYLIRKRGGR